MARPRARLASFNPELEEAARDLGAGEWRIFRDILVPHMRPGLAAGALLAFTMSLDDFVITFFSTGPGATTLPIYIFGLLRNAVTPEINALSAVWIITVLVALLLAQQFQRREAL